MKRVLLIFAVLFVVLAVFIFVQSLLKNGSLFAKTASMTVNDEKITLEVADTPEKRQKGLSGRKSLPENRGMLFVFDNADFHSFWMKEMQIPLDMIFLSGTRVVTVHENVPPPTEGDENLLLYSPDEPTDKVIELNAGQAAKLQIQKGTELDLKL